MSADLNETLKDLEIALASITDEMRDQDEPTNPILYAESGPNRFFSISLFFNDCDGVEIQEDLELNEISISLFNDSDRIQLVSGPLYDWALAFYKADTQ